MEIATEAILIPQSQKRFRNEEEKIMIQTQIAELRLQGKTFVEIGNILSLNERHIRRLYEQFLFYKNQDYNFRKNIVLGEMIHNLEYSIEFSNKQLAKAVEEYDPRLIILWQKVRQESLRDYHSFLNDMGLSSHWLKTDPSKPVGMPEWAAQPWPGDSELDII